MSKRVLAIHHCGFVSGAGNSLMDVLGSLDVNEYDITIYVKDADSKDMYNRLQESGRYTVKSYGDYPTIFGFYSGNEKALLNPWNLVSLVKIRKNRKNLEKILEEERPDIVLVNTMCLFWMGSTIKKFGAKGVIFVRETYAREFLPVRNPIMKRAIRTQFDKAVYITEYDYRETGGTNQFISTDKYEPSVGTEERVVLPFQKEKDKSYILFLGGRSLIKGVETAVQGLVYLPENVELVIAGCTEIMPNNMKGNWRTHAPWSDIYRLNKLDQFIDKHQLQSRIHYTGMLKDVTPVIEACDVEIIPTLRQHQARPFIEAGIMRKPVVISDMPCVRDEARNEENCLIFPIGDAETMAKQIRRFLDEPSLRKKCVENNCSWMSTHHEKKMLAKEMKELFSSL